MVRPVVVLDESARLAIEEAVTEAVRDAVRKSLRAVMAEIMQERRALEKDSDDAHKTEARH